MYFFVDQRNIASRRLLPLRFSTTVSAKSPIMNKSRDAMVESLRTKSPETSTRLSVAMLYMRTSGVGFYSFLKKEGGKFSRFAEMEKGNRIDFSAGLELGKKEKSLKAWWPKTSTSRVVRFQFAGCLEDIRHQHSGESKQGDSHMNENCGNLPEHMFICQTS